MLLKEEKLDPRVRRTRTLLEQAFMELMHEKSLPTISVQDITTRARVNRATFYAHFDDKYALFYHVIRKDFRELLQSKLPEAAQFSPENLRLLIVAVCEFLGQFNRKCHPADTQFRPMIEMQVQSQLYELILEWISPLQARRVSEEITASVMSWAIFGAGLQWSENQSTQTVHEVADQVYKLLIEGILHKQSV